MVSIRVPTFWSLLYGIWIDPNVLIWSPVQRPCMYHTATWSLWEAEFESLTAETQILAETVPGAPSMQRIPTVGPKVCKSDLLWAFWSPTVSDKKPQLASLRSFAPMKSFKSQEAALCGEY